jgi:shikimate kinase
MRQLKTKKNIILIGFMGAGKTSVAKKLHFLSNFELLDTDNIISKRLDISIPQLFQDKGEAFFREQETLVLKDLGKAEACIISTGGGIILNPHNHKLLQKLGFVFWLKVSPSEVLNRITNPDSRPLLANAADKLGTVTDLLKQREHLYAETAHFEIETDHKSLGEISQEIWNIYKTSQKI